MGFHIGWGRTLRIWAFDVEARPGPWIGGDFVTKHLLSIAGGYEDGDIEYLAPGFSKRALSRFVKPLRDGILVVTHNGPRYDLPFLNGTLIRYDLPPLGPVLVSDTYAHLLKRGRAFSASLGNLAGRFDISAKGHMSEPDWDAVYRGERWALDKLKDYNIGDVRSTLQLRRELVARGLLRPPRVWRP